MSHFKTRLAELGSARPKPNGKSPRYKPPHHTQWRSWFRFGYGGIGGVMRSQWFLWKTRMYEPREWDQSGWRECMACGVQSGSKRLIQYRSQLYHWDGTQPWEKRPDLCMPCWNRLRPVAKRRDEIENIERLIRKLQRTASERRRQTRTAGHPGPNGTESYSALSSGEAHG